VRSNGEIKWKGALIYISSALINDLVGLTETEEGSFEVRFYNETIGCIVRGEQTLSPLKPRTEKGADQRKL